jgi:hypothetical protein
MAFYSCKSVIMVFVTLAVLAVQHTADARTIRGAFSAADALASSSATSALSHRRMLAAPGQPARMATVSTADEHESCLLALLSAPCCDQYRSSGA